MLLWKGRLKKTKVAHFTRKDGRGLSRCEFESIRLLGSRGQKETIELRLMSEVRSWFFNSSPVLSPVHEHIFCLSFWYPPHCVLISFCIALCTPRDITLHFRARCAECPGEIDLCADCFCVGVEVASYSLNNPSRYFVVNIVSVLSV